MEVHIRIESTPAGLSLHSAMADGAVGQPAPDEVVTAILHRAWEIMFTQCIVKRLEADKRVQSADIATLKRLPRFEP